MNPYQRIGLAVKLRLTSYDPLGCAEQILLSLQKMPHIIIIMISLIR
jgi:hypothetical protein